MCLVLLSRSRHMQYIFYINIVKQQLQLLFEELKRIEEYSKYNRSKLKTHVQQAYDQFLCRRLFVARDYYSSIFEISIHINEAFGWSHLVNLTHSFVQILTDSYWCYWNIDNNSDVFLNCKIFTKFKLRICRIRQHFFTDSSLGIVSSIVIVFLVFGYTTELHAMVKKVYILDSGSEVYATGRSFSE